MLELIRNAIGSQPFRLEEANEIWNKIEMFYDTKKYMIPKKTQKDIDDFRISTLMPVAIGLNDESIRDIQVSFCRVNDIVKSEWKSIIDNIREYYGYLEEDKHENLKR